LINYQTKNSKKERKDRKREREKEKGWKEGLTLIDDLAIVGVLLNCNYLNNFDYNQERYKRERSRYLQSHQRVQLLLYNCETNSMNCDMRIRQFLLIVNVQFTLFHVFCTSKTKDVLTRNLRKTKKNKLNGF
jgi:hypothetical protein